jgi:hypothetical protein
MYSEGQFLTLEMMCRERAVIAAQELEYWLAEAEEWAQIKLSCKGGGERLVSSLLSINDVPIE